MSKMWCEYHLSLDDGRVHYIYDGITGDDEDSTILCKTVLTALGKV